MASVYVETSIVSFAAARLAADPVVMVRQIEARRWWDEYAPRFDLVASQLVLDEVGRGDPAAARNRLALLNGVRLVPISAEVVGLADELLSRSLLPRIAVADALHVAAAVVGRVDYLLTLNCKHIANAFMLPRIYATIEELRAVRLLICTPEEFFGGDYDADA